MGIRGVVREIFKGYGLVTPQWPPWWPRLLTHHRESGRKEAECVDNRRYYSVRNALDMLTDILTGCDQQSGHQEHYEGPSVVQLEHKVVDHHPGEIELEVLPHRTKGVQHCRVAICFDPMPRLRFFLNFFGFLGLSVCYFGWGFGPLRLRWLTPRNCKARNYHWLWFSGSRFPDFLRSDFPSDVLRLSGPPYRVSLSWFFVFWPGDSARSRRASTTELKYDKIAP